MPILPENKHRYPANWKEIRKRILERARHRCEFCGIPNYLTGWRDPEGYFWPAAYIAEQINEGRDVPTWWEGEDFDSPRYKPMKIILTIAHMDHTPEHCDDENLRALCQQCHNRHDAKHRSLSRRKRKGQLGLDLGGAAE